MLYLETQLEICATVLYRRKIEAIDLTSQQFVFLRNRVLDQNRHAPTWRRRGGLATTDVRRNIYRQNMYVNPESVVDTTGRYRDTSPEWFRSNPAQTHRLVPWLNRELNALLEDPQRTNYLVTQEILELITVSLPNNLMFFPIAL